MPLFNYFFVNHYVTSDLHSWTPRDVEMIFAQKFLLNLARKQDIWIVGKNVKCTPVIFVLFTNLNNHCFQCMHFKTLLAVTIPHLHKVLFWEHKATQKTCIIGVSGTALPNWTTHWISLLATCVWIHFFL